MYENIVVAFDGSKHSKAALMETANWIKLHGGSAVLVHAVYFDEEEFGIIPEQLEQRMNFGKKLCDQAKEDISSAFGINLESIICEGDPADTLVGIAHAKKADLIALGTHGRSSIKKLIMGSVTSGVIGKATCDVLVVKKADKGWSGRYSSILLPFDGSGPSMKALEQACRISVMDGSAVSVLYVVPRYEEMVEFFRSSAIQDSLMKEAQKITASAVELAAKKGVKVKVLIGNGDVSSKISETAIREKSDLIIMGSHGWGGVNKAYIGSTTERLIMHANSPILVVR